MATPEDRLILLDLLYAASTALQHEKAAAYGRLNTEIDRVRFGTIYSRHDIKNLLYKDGYQEFAKRRRLQEQNGF